jgi:hypothetical protein
LKKKKTFDEILAPIRAGRHQSGMTEQEIDWPRKPIVSDNRTQAAAFDGP